MKKQVIKIAVPLFDQQPGGLSLAPPLGQCHGEVQIGHHFLEPARGGRRTPVKIISPGDLPGRMPIKSLSLSISGTPEIHLPPKVIGRGAKNVVIPNDFRLKGQRRRRAGQKKTARIPMIPRRGDTSVRQRPLWERLLSALVVHPPSLRRPLRDKRNDSPVFGRILIRLKCGSVRKFRI